MKKRLILGTTMVLFSALGYAQDMPSVTYTATGSAGSWDLEFTLTNNLLPGEGDLYFLGVYLDTGRNVVSSPSNWDCERFREWSNQSYGGSDLRYNNVWLNLYSRPDDILANGSKSGFRVHTSSLAAPTSLPFFSFAAAGIYQGNSNYSNYWNPGFEGTAHLVPSSPVPEPASLAIVGVGLVTLVRRRRNK